MFVFRDTHFSDYNQVFDPEYNDDVMRYFHFKISEKQKALSILDVQKKLLYASKEKMHKKKDDQTQK